MSCETQSPTWGEQEITDLVINEQVALHLLLGVAFDVVLDHLAGRPIPDGVRDALREMRRAYKKMAHVIKEAELDHPHMREARRVSMRKILDEVAKSERAFCAAVAEVRKAWWSRHLTGPDDGSVGLP